MEHSALAVSDLIEDVDDRVLRIRSTVRMVTALADPANDSPDPDDVLGYLGTLEEALDQVHTDLWKVDRILAKPRRGTGTVRHRKANGTQRQPGLALVKGTETPAAR